MKNLLNAFFTIIILTGCNGKNEKTISDSTENSQNQKLPKKQLSPEEEGKELVEGADCISCHQIDAKLIGPSYREIAEKYTDADLEILADKIINGSNGVWGPVMMTPHSGLTKENARKMVKYILSLKPTDTAIH